MRKLTELILCLVTAVSLSGCGARYGANIHTESSTTGVSEVLESGMAEATAEPTAEPEAEVSKEAEGEDVAYENIEVDLTSLSATMVYSEVYNMLTQPDSYLGKTVRMAGQYTEHYNEQTDTTYFACIILDATACCAQGMEFDLIDRYVYPGDYPKEGDMICVEGVYDRYEEDGFPYYTLRNAVLVES